MTLPWLATETIERLRPGSKVDQYHNAVADWATPSVLVIAGCSLQPMAGPEFVQDRESIVSRWDLYTPPGADIESTDRIRHAGRTYDIDGSVQRWVDPTGCGLDHTSATLREV